MKKDTDAWDALATLLAAKDFRIMKPIDTLEALDEFLTDKRVQSRWLKIDFPYGFPFKDKNKKL